MSSQNHLGDPTKGDPIGIRYTFDDGEVLDLMHGEYGWVKSMDMWYSWYAHQHQPFTHQKSLDMYERAKQCTKTETIFGDSFIYR